VRKRIRCNRLFYPLHMHPFSAPDAGGKGTTVLLFDDEHCFGSNGTGRTFANEALRRALAFLATKSGIGHLCCLLCILNYRGLMLGYHSAKAEVMLLSRN
jgi:hypothetical protein